MRIKKLFLGLVVLATTIMPLPVGATNQLESVVYVMDKMQTRIETVNLITQSTGVQKYVDTVEAKYLFLTDAKNSLDEISQQSDEVTQEFISSISSAIGKIIDSDKQILSAFSNRDQAGLDKALDQAETANSELTSSIESYRRYTYWHPDLNGYLIVTLVALLIVSLLLLVAEARFYKKHKADQKVRPVVKKLVIAAVVTVFLSAAALIWYVWLVGIWPSNVLLFFVPPLIGFAALLGLMFRYLRVNRRPKAEKDKGIKVEVKVAK
jgi:hypothetical protein